MHKFLILMVLVAAGCTGFLDKGPVVNAVNNNVLLQRITYSTADSTETYIEFWKDGDASHTRRSGFSKGKDHVITLANLKAETTYKYTVRNAAGKRSDEFSLTTGKLPDEVFKIRKLKVDTTVFDGLVLIRRFHKIGVDALIDKEGDVVWYNMYDTAVRRAFSFTLEHTVLSIYDTSKVVEYTLTGEKVLDISLTTPPNLFHVHHEIFSDKDKNIVLLSSDSMQLNLKKFGGKEKQFIRGPGILKIDRRGNKLWKWNMLQGIDLKKMKDVDVKDPNWGHGNSIVVAADGNYLISLRDYNQIWKVNATTGDIMWKLGEGGDFKMDEKGLFIKQHSINFWNGDLVMFDNGDAKLRPQSRVLVLSLDEEKKVATTEVAIDLPRRLSSYRMCSAYPIDADKFLVCTTKKDLALSVVDTTGKIVWQIIADNASYRAYYIPETFNSL